MELDRKLVEQAQDSLISYLDSVGLSKDHVENFFDDIYGLDNILRPLCSRCENAEPNIDIIVNYMQEPWWYLLDISCRCAKTCKEYVSRRRYFNKNGEVSPDKERYPGNIIHKACCIHFSPQNA